MTMPTVATHKTRIRIFVDYWNLQLTLNTREEKQSGATNVRFAIDWHSLPALICANAALTLGVTDFSYEGTIIYTSHDPKATDRGFYKLAYHLA